jgi:hypothetical protein
MFQSFLELSSFIFFVLALWGQDSCLPRSLVLRSNQGRAPVVFRSAGGTSGKAYTIPTIPASALSNACHRDAWYLLRTVTTWWHRWRACYTFKLDWHLHSQITECWILNWNWIELSCHLKSEENYTMNNGTTRSSAFNCELGDSGSEKCPGEENLARWNVELRNNLKHTSDLIVLNSAFLEL